MKKNNNELNILLISGNSFTGKSSLSNLLCSTYPNLFKANISTTTREQREGEINGKDYYFIKDEEIDLSLMYETNYIGKDFYGSEKKELEDAIKSNKILVMVKDPHGINSVWGKDELAGIPINSIKYVHFSTSHDEILSFVTNNKKITSFDAVEIEDRLDRYDFDRYANKFKLEEKADLVINGYECTEKCVMDLVMSNLYNEGENKMNELRTIKDINEIRTIEQREAFKKDVKAYYQDVLIPAYLDSDISDTQKQREKGLIEVIATNYNELKKECFCLLELSADIPKNEKQHLERQLNVMFNSIDIELSVWVEGIEICEENKELMWSTINEITDAGGMIGGMNFTKLKNENEAIYFIPTIKDAIENSVLTSRIGEEKSSNLISFLEDQQEKYPALVSHMKNIYIHLETTLGKEKTIMNKIDVGKTKEYAPSAPSP